VHELVFALISILFLSLIAFKFSYLEQNAYTTGCKIEDLLTKNPFSGIVKSIHYQIEETKANLDFLNWIIGIKNPLSSISYRITVGGCHILYREVSMNEFYKIYKAFLEYKGTGVYFYGKVIGNYKFPIEIPIYIAEIKDLGDKYNITITRKNVNSDYLNNKNVSLVSSDKMLDILIMGYEENKIPLYALELKIAAKIGAWAGEKVLVVYEENNPH